MQSCNELPADFAAQVFENYQRMYVPEGKPEVKDDKEPLRATVFYQVVQVSAPMLTPRRVPMYLLLPVAQRCRAGHWSSRRAHRGVWEQ